MAKLCNRSGETGLEPRTSCSASQKLNHYITAVPWVAGSIPGEAFTCIFILGILLASRSSKLGEAYANKIKHVYFHVVYQFM